MKWFLTKKELMRKSVFVSFKTQTFWNFESLHYGGNEALCVCSAAVICVSVAACKTFSSRVSEFFKGAERPVTSQQAHCGPLRWKIVGFAAEKFALPH